MLSQSSKSSGEGVDMYFLPRCCWPAVGRERFPSALIGIRGFQICSDLEKSNPSLPRKRSCCNAKFKRSSETSHGARRTPSSVVSVVCERLNAWADFLSEPRDSRSFRRPLNRFRCKMHDHGKESWNLPGNEYEASESTNLTRHERGGGSTAASAKVLWSSKHVSNADK